MEKLRLDKWLWAARFYKTRSAATDAINKGRVAVNGQTTKPSRNISVGDCLLINRIPYRFEVTVLGLNDKRRPASEARELYQESDQSIQARQEEAERFKADRMISQGLRGSGRPSKRQRRQIIRFQDAVLPDASELGDSHSDEE